MRKIPTDLQILNAIYERYCDQYAAFDKATNYVPISVKDIAADLRADGNIVFGRLHYDLEKRYGYVNPDGLRVPFFALKVGDDTHVVHFPYLASVLAELRERKSQYRLATGIAILSLVIAAVSLTISFFALW